MEPCIDPSAISDDALAIYAFDSTMNDDATQAHIAACLYCRAEVNSLRATLHFIDEYVGRFTCPSVESLQSYVTGSLTRKERTALTQHIKQCIACTDEIAAIQTANADLEEWVVLPERTPVTRLNELIAILIAPKPPFAVNAQGSLRGDRIEDTHVYVAGNYRVSLTVQQASGGIMLSGNVATSDGDASTLHSAQIYSQAAALDAAPLAEDTITYGTFAFADLARDSYTLRLVGDDTAVTLILPIT